MALRGKECGRVGDVLLACAKRAQPELDNLCQPGGPGGGVAQAKRLVYQFVVASNGPCVERQSQRTVLCLPGPDCCPRGVTAKMVIVIIYTGPGTGPSTLHLLSLNAITLRGRFVAVSP